MDDDGRVIQGGSLDRVPEILVRRKVEGQQVGAITWQRGAAEKLSETERR
ncbi:hypothetical protein [Sphingomonas sp. BK036]|nr:hypothetical protein [Sphingomonas sp. BK036]